MQAFHPKEESELYKLAVKLLASCWYDKRCPIDTIGKSIEYSLGAIISQLQWGEDGQ